MIWGHPVFKSGMIFVGIEDIFSASWILNNYVTSFVIEEYRIKEAADEDLIDSFEALPFDISSFDRDREYQFGLEVLVEGFKSKVNETSAQK
ncbi:hypothetical protein [Paenibacillus sp. DMB20]|uniref:hypothetical protein n=1 Tax=Paenibacillus sp. DMB20 TaxID=1642570 RepID=UPI0006279AB9|nr:hypothetical protein [Paenibacillus sp. DMB20]KKO55216.1 hypothetical protein XI25_02370 [Paenibacillus sp. DMB20]